MVEENRDTIDRRTVLQSTAALVGTGALGGLAAGSDGRGRSPGVTGRGRSAGSGRYSRLALDAPFPSLASGHYEGWAIYGDEKVSTGTFGAGDDLTFAVDRNLLQADAVAVTIEPDDDRDPGPSGIVYLAGAVDGPTPDLSFPVSFPSDLSGTYILATPTNGPDSHETAGVWFIDPRGGPSPGLAALPDLPAGWTYEGWAVTQGKPISTGRFDDPAAPDDFDGHSGPRGAPPLPGEDLLQNAPSGVSFPADLADGTSAIVVSVEPDLDGTDPTGPAPFAVKPLVGHVSAGLDDHSPAGLSANLGTVPEGSATILPGRGRARGRR